MSAVKTQRKRKFGLVEEKGLAIAACTEASEVLLSDGNPQVVYYIQTNIEANGGVLGDTKVSACMLHWSRHQVAMPRLNYDVIVAADCTFFKDFHLDLAHTIKGLLGVSDGCQAILFSPRIGNTLDQFVKACHSAKLNVGITEQYDARIWNIHKGFLTNDGNSAWPNYYEEHCYPLLLSITHTDS
jgi:calmodulin-lysine N-methyltransferase